MWSKVRKGMDRCLLSAWRSGDVSCCGAAPGTTASRTFTTVTTVVGESAGVSTSTTMTGTVLMDETTETCIAITIDATFPVDRTNWKVLGSTTPDAQNAFASTTKGWNRSRSVREGDGMRRRGGPGGRLDPSSPDAAGATVTTSEHRPSIVSVTFAYRMKAILPSESGWANPRANPGVNPGANPAVFRWGFT